MSSFFNRQTLLNTDGEPISSTNIHKAWLGKQPHLAIVYRAVCDMIVGVCGSDLIRIISHNNKHGEWCMGVEDASLLHGSKILYDWILYNEPDSLYDVIKIYLSEIKSSAPKLVINNHSHKMIKLLQQKP